MQEELPHLDIHFLGEFRVLQGGCVVAGLEGTRTRDLFARLVLARGAPIEYKSISKEVWEGAGDTGTLRVCLNRMLKADPLIALPLLDERRIVRRPRGTLALDLTNATVDVFRFEDGCASSAVREVAMAVDLYAGELLPGCTLEMVAGLRVELNERYLVALNALIFASTRDGDFERAVRYMERRLAKSPWDEGWIEALMDLHVQRDEINAAIKVFTDYDKSLPPKVRPGDALFRKYLSLKEGDPRRKTRGSWTPSDHALIPDPLPAIVGRESAIREIEALLQHTRLVTLKGAAGVGKTLLAQHVGAQQMAAYNGRVAFIDLSSASSLADVQRRTFGCVGAGVHDADSLEQAIERAIGADRMLIIMDNCERILEQTTTYLRQLMQKAPRLKVIATSQIAWRKLAGETMYHVRPLQPPSAQMLSLTPDALARALTHVEAVDLYFREAASIQPSIKLTAENAHVIARLVRMLDGLPLALKLAAGTSHTLTPEQTLAALEVSLDILRDRLGTLPVKHRALQAALHLSYDQAPEDTQQALQRLSVCRGWTLDVAAAVTAASDIADKLLHLQERSLVQAEPVAGALRFSMFQTTRRFVERLCETSLATGARTRLLNYLVRFASDVSPHLKGPDQTVWLSRLRPETENIRASLDWALESNQRNAGLKLALAVWRLWLVDGAYAEGYKYIDRLIGAAADDSTRMLAYGIAGNLAHHKGDLVNAQRCYTEWQNVAHRCEQPRVEVKALGSLGNIASIVGDHAEAKRLLEEALAILHAADERDEPAIDVTLGNLAANAFRMEDWNSAQGFAARAVAGFRSREDHSNLATALANEAEALFRLSRSEDAVDAIAESLSLSAVLCEWRTISHCHAQLLAIAVAMSAWNAAGSLEGLHSRFAEYADLGIPAEVKAELQTHRNALAATIGSAALAEAARLTSNVDPEQCVSYMQAICSGLKDSLRAATK